MILFLSFILFCFGEITTTSTTPTIVLNGQDATIELYPSLMFYVEEEKVPFDQIRLNQVDFTSLKESNIYKRFKDKSLWVRFQVNNISDERLNYIISVKNSYLLFGEVIIDRNGSIETLGSYSSFSLDEKQLFYNLPHWEILFEPESFTKVYIRLYDDIKRTRILTTLEPKEKFENLRFSYILLNGAYLFFFGLVCLLAFILAIRTKQYYIFYYVFYLLLFSLEFFAMKGIGYPLFLKHLPFLLENFRLLTNPISTILLSLFLRDFYHQLGAPKGLSVFLNCFVVLFVFVLIVALYNISYPLRLPLVEWLMNLLCLYAFLLIIVHFYLRRIRLIPLYLPLVFSLHLISVIIQISWDIPYRNNSLYLWFTRNLYFISLSVELSFWGYYLFTKIMQIDLENKKLNQQVKQLKTNAIHQKESMIMLRLKSKALIQVENIIYIKSDNKYLEFYTKIGREIDRNTLKHALEKLPPQQFVQCHKSYVVNLLEIRQIYANKIILNNGETLPLSRSYKAKMQQLFD